MQTGARLTIIFCARVAELAYAHDSKSCPARDEGSTPSSGTINHKGLWQATRLIFYIKITKDIINYQHQKDLNGCGIACLSNLLNLDYDYVKKDFETKFYSIEKGIKIFDIVKYFKTLNLEYKSKFFNQNKKYKLNIIEAKKYSEIEDSITLIAKNYKYPVGHYLLRIKNGWVDPWYNLPSIDNVKAGLRKELPNNPWYVLYPKNNLTPPPQP